MEHAPSKVAMLWRAHWQHKKRRGLGVVMYFEVLGTRQMTF